MSNISDIEESVIATTDAIQNYVTAQIKGKYTLLILLISIASSNDYELLNDVNTTTAAQCGMYSSSARSSIESLERITFKCMSCRSFLLTTW